MAKLMILCALLLAISAPPVHAMTEQTSKSNVPDQKSQMSDPDDAEEQFSDGPTNAGGPSGREEQLLGSHNSGGGQTYGFSDGAYGQGGWGYFGSAGGSMSGGFR